jgi:hypothetical protein
LIRYGSIMLRVKKVLYLHGYVLQVHFSNGKAREIDFKPLISKGGFYLEPLQEISLFKQVALDDMKYSICWPNGADFDPDTLYEMGKPIPSRPIARRKSPARKRSYSKRS